MMPQENVQNTENAAPNTGNLSTNLEKVTLAEHGYQVPHELRPNAPDEQPSGGRELLEDANQSDDLLHDIEPMEEEVQHLAAADPIEEEVPGGMRPVSPPPPATAEEILPSEEQNLDQQISLDSEPTLQEQDPQNLIEPPSQGPLDSISVGQLRTLINPQKSKTRQYSYPTDADADSIAMEIDEFYSYVEAPQVEENRAAWEEWCTMTYKSNDKEAPPHRSRGKSGSALGLGLDGNPDPISVDEDVDRSLFEWTSLPTSARRKRIQALLTLLEVKDPETRQRTSRALLYLLQGSFADTHGTEHQLSWILENARMVRAAGGLGEIYSAFKLASWKHDWLSSLPDNIPSSEPVKDGEPSPEPLLTWQMKLEYLDEINLELALNFAQLYILVETQRGDEEWGDELMSLDPPLPMYLFSLVSSLREKNAKGYPVKKLLLLVWKCLLACFGGLKDIARCKDLARDLEGLPAKSTRKNDTKKRKYVAILMLITYILSIKAVVTKATPLDLQSFQDELAVKYPTYVPSQRQPGDLPVDKIASAVAPIPPRKPMGHTDSACKDHLPNNGGFTSTPAPSPPPSPKPNKQKYQTDQNRPFVFPYSTSVQGHRLVPYSIDEASKLYRDNMYVSLELWQLWRLREECIHEESGVASAADGTRLGFGAWDKEIYKQELLSHLAEGSSQGSKSPEMTEAGSSRATSGPSTAPSNRSRGEPTPDRLEAIERELDVEVSKAESDHMLAVIDNDRYTDNLSKLQEKRADVRRLHRIDMFYRAVLPHLQSGVIVLLKLLLATVTQQNNNNSPHFQAIADGIAIEDAPPPTLEDIDIVRHREITSKAISGILLLLLKWFKVSHVMKFNYISQLLVDSNCLLLILKMFGLTEVNNQVKVVNEIPNFNFFKFCELNCGQEPRRPRPEDTVLAKQPFEGMPSPPMALAHLNSAVEDVEPMDRYSFRNFFSGLNFTRILQKLTKRKTHRILLLVQYKSSAILKRTLKVPHPDLQLYALKVIKNQVQFCGRKWRQSNMKVITAIYLKCRPDLRDEWLNGTDIDGDVEESLPQEQALRSLVKYYNQTRIGNTVSSSSIGHGHRRSISSSLGSHVHEAFGGQGGIRPDSSGDANPSIPGVLASPNASNRTNANFFESETLPPLRRTSETTAGTRRYIPDDLLDGYLDDYEDLIGELFGDSDMEGVDSNDDPHDDNLYGLSAEGSRAAWGALNQMLGEDECISDSESVGSVGLMNSSSNGNNSEDTSASSEDDGAQTWEQLSPQAMKYLTSNRPATPGMHRRRTSHGSDDGDDNGSPLRPVMGIDDNGTDKEFAVAEDLQPEPPLPEPAAGGIDEVEHVWGS